jgi:hypothetical protein
MKGSVVIVLFTCFLAGCQGGGMKVLSATQEEVISLAYQDSEGTRGVQGTSTTGESFAGSLQWTKGQRSSGHYSGTLVGESGRAIEVSLGCDSMRRECAGTGKDNDGKVYFVF